MGKINKVGTFGVNCASYWWTWISAAGYHLIGLCPLDRLLSADDLESLATSREGRIRIVLSYSYLSAMGYPFKWAKTCARFRVEWLGMETEYSGYRLGLTEKRSGWLVSWLRDKVELGHVTATEMCGYFAVPGPSLCLVLSDTRPIEAYEDTGYAEGPFHLACR